MDKEKVSLQLWQCSMLHTAVQSMCITHRPSAEQTDCFCTISKNHFTKNVGDCWMYLVGLYAAISANHQPDIIFSINQLSHRNIMLFHVVSV